MSILPIRSLHCFSIFQRSMIQTNELPLCEVLDSSLIAEIFHEDKVSFGNASEDVFTPAITLWAMVSQFLFSGAGRSCKAAAGRVVSLLAQTADRVVAQNAGNYCRAKAKIPVPRFRRSHFGWPAKQSKTRLHLMIRLWQSMPTKRKNVCPHE